MLNEIYFADAEMYVEEVCTTKVKDIRTAVKFVSRVESDNFE
jgi:hypothetical protein